jgi:hypothetical protein
MALPPTLAPFAYAGKIIFNILAEPPAALAADTGSTTKPYVPFNFDPAVVVSDNSRLFPVTNR